MAAGVPAASEIQRRHPPSRGQPHGRYDGRKDARAPAGGLARVPLRNKDLVVGAVADPWGDGKARDLVSINRKVDLLEDERSHHRIDEAAYMTGRLLQAVFERATRTGGSSFEGGSRSDPREQRILLLARRICDARDCLDLERRLERIGLRYIRLLRHILGRGKSFAEVAAVEGKAGPRGTSFIAESFRCALADAVSAIQESRGAARPPDPDKHLAASGTTPPRQTASVAGGATRRRLTGELPGLRAAAAATRSARERARLTDEADRTEAHLARLGRLEDHIRDGEA